LKEQEKDDFNSLCRRTLSSIAAKLINEQENLVREIKEMKNESIGRLKIVAQFALFTIFSQRFFVHIETSSLSWTYLFSNDHPVKPWSS
jgi:hypothetical protein